MKGSFMPQLMPLNWNISIFMLAFFLMMMFNIYVWYNEMNWKMNCNIDNFLIFNWLW